MYCRNNEHRFEYYILKRYYTIYFYSMITMWFTINPPITVVPRTIFTTLFIKISQYRKLSLYQM